MTGWRRFFAAAALFNLVIGAGYALAPTMMLAAAGMTGAYPDLGWRLLGWCVLTFGVGYGYVALRPGANPDLVRIGVIGKLGVFSVVAAMWQGGQASGLLLAGGCADLLWAVAFIAFLRGAPRPATDVGAR